MPIPVNCPNCGTGLKAPDSAAGRTVRCPKCSTQFGIPAAGAQPLGSVSAAPLPAYQPAPQPPSGYDNYDNYRDEGPGYRRRPPPRPSEPGTGVQMGMGIASLSVGAAGLVIGLIPCIGFWPGLIAGGIGLVLGLVGLIVAMTQQGRGVAFPIAGAATSVVAMLVTFFWTYWVIRSWTNTVDNAFQHAGRQQQQIQQWQQGFDKMAKEMQRQKLNQPPVGNPAAPPTPSTAAVPLNNGTGSVEGELTDKDPFDRIRLNCKCKVYTVNLEAGRTYQIDLMSNQFDAYLRVEDANGAPLAQDDDSGEGRNARLRYVCNRTGVYRLVATTFGPAVGQFTLRVQRQ
jgi:hypothetical protein